MNLFMIDGPIVRPTVECLMIPVFSLLWERDPSPNKEVARKEFAYIEFCLSPLKSNLYSGYPENIRPEKVQKALYPNGDFRMDEELEDAMNTYTELLEDASYSLRYLNAAIRAADNLMNFLEQVDVNERNDKGGVIFKSSEITKALNDTPNVLKSLQTLREKVHEELTTTKTRGGRETNYFEERPTG